MTELNTIDEKEVEKFAAMADDWWNPNGKFRPLHKFNPTRLKFIRDNVMEHYGTVSYTHLDVYKRQVPGFSSPGSTNELNTRTGTFLAIANSTERVCKTFAPNDAISSISS